MRASDFPGAVTFDGCVFHRTSVCSFSGGRLSVIYHRGADDCLIVRHDEGRFVMERRSGLVIVQELVEDRGGGDQKDDQDHSVHALKDC